MIKLYYKSLRKAPYALITAFLSLAPSDVKASAGNSVTPPKQKWSFEGMNGSFDRAAAQRGFLVYSKVCAACHSLDLLRFDKLKGLGLTPAEVSALAATFEVKNKTPNEAGEMFTRKGEGKDHFPNPYPNEQAARAANNGAFPPNLSIITKARFGGANYVYALLTGYNHSVPEGITIPDGLYYNPYMDGGKIAMPPPLSEGLVTYEDGTEATVEQMAKDVTTFLAWASEPTMEHRKSLGINVLLYLIFVTGLFYAAMRKIWANLK